MQTETKKQRTRKKFKGVKVWTVRKGDESKNYVLTKKTNHDKHNFCFNN